MICRLKQYISCVIIIILKVKRHFRSDSSTSIYESIYLRKQNKQIIQLTNCSVCLWHLIDYLRVTATYSTGNILVFYSVTLKNHALLY